MNTFVWQFLILSKTAILEFLSHFKKYDWAVIPTKIHTGPLQKLLFKLSSHGNISLLSTAYTVSQRHWLLERSIGTMLIEDKAFETIWITILVSLIIFIVGPILSCFIFKKANGSLHPCFGIIADEVEKEENKTKRKCCKLF
jgi:hypothetical protein